MDLQGWDQSGLRKCSFSGEKKKTHLLVRSLVDWSTINENMAENGHFWRKTPPGSLFLIFQIAKTRISSDLHDVCHCTKNEDHTSNGFCIVAQTQRTSSSTSDSMTSQIFRNITKQERLLILPSHPKLPHPDLYWYLFPSSSCRLLTWKTLTWPFVESNLSALNLSSHFYGWFIVTVSAPWATIRSDQI